MNQNEAMEEVKNLQKGIAHDALELQKLLGTGAVQWPIKGTDQYVVVGTLSTIAAVVRGIAPGAAVSQPAGDLTDERAKFEAEFEFRYRPGTQHDVIGWYYFDDEVEQMWKAWQARAAIAAHLAGQSQATKVQAVPDELTDEAIDEVWDAMPGGADGWLKQFGYRQFARSIARHVLVRVAASMAGTIRPTDDELWEQTIGERDNYHEWADKLAGAIAKHFDAEIGEHSNMNCPWVEALEVIECAAPTAQEVTQQAAKAETAEQAECVQASIEPAYYIRHMDDSYSLAEPQPSLNGVQAEWRALDLYDEIECDLPHLFGRASNEGHEVGQQLAQEVRAKMQRARSLNQQANVLPPTRDPLLYPDGSAGEVLEMKCFYSWRAKHLARPGWDDSDWFIFQKGLADGVDRARTELSKRQLPTRGTDSQHEAIAGDAAHYLPPVAPKGPFADYSAEEVEAYAGEYASALRALLSEILMLATQGMCHGLLADDYCSQIVAKIKARAPTTSTVSAPGSAQIPDVIREAVEAAFEERNGWRIKIAAAVRALDDSGSAQASQAAASEAARDAARWQFIVRDGHNLNGRFTLVVAAGDSLTELHGSEYAAKVDEAMRTNPATPASKPNDQE